MSVAVRRPCQYPFGDHACGAESSAAAIFDDGVRWCVCAECEATFKRAVEHIKTTRLFTDVPAHMRSDFARGIVVTFEPLPALRGGR